MGGISQDDPVRACGNARMADLVSASPLVSGELQDELFMCGHHVPFFSSQDIRLQMFLPGV